MLNRWKGSTHGPVPFYNKFPSPAYISALFQNKISLKNHFNCQNATILNVNTVISATGKQVKCSWNYKPTAVITGQRFFSVSVQYGMRQGPLQRNENIWIKMTYIFAFVFYLDRFGLGQAGRIPGSVNAMRVLSTSTDLEAAVADALVRGPMCVESLWITDLHFSLSSQEVASKSGH